MTNLSQQLQQLEAEEQKLLNRLAQIRREKKQITRSQQAKQPEQITLDTNSLTYHTREQLQSLSKSQVLQIATTLHIETATAKRTKKDIVELILNRQRAYRHGEAFASM